MGPRLILAALLVLLFGFAAESEGGFQDLRFIYQQPAEGVRVGDTVPLVVMTTWKGQPLPHRLVYVTAHRPAPNGRTFPTTWVFKTDAEGLATVLVEIAPFDYPGIWHISGFTVGLPDGTSDGDGVQVIVGPR
jgi:hypothetical protein